AAVVVTPVATGSGTITNGASVSGGQADLVSANNSASLAVPVVAVGTTADLAVSASAAPGPATLGSPLTYTGTGSGNGPAGATGVTATLTLPASETYGSATPSQGTCSQTGQTVSCLLGSIAAAANATFAVVATPSSQAGPLTATAAASGTQTDP